jgi:hypothetical protein
VQKLEDDKMKDYLILIEINYIWSFLLISIYFRINSPVLDFSPLTCFLRPFAERETTDYHCVLFCYRPFISSETKQSFYILKIPHISWSVYKSKTFLLQTIYLSFTQNLSLIINSFKKKNLCVYFFLEMNFL